MQRSHVHSTKLLLTYESYTLCCHFHPDMYTRDEIELRWIEQSEQGQPSWLIVNNVPQFNLYEDEPLKTSNFTISEVYYYNYTIGKWHVTRLTRFLFILILCSRYCGGKQIWSDLGPLTDGFVCLFTLTLGKVCHVPSEPPYQRKSVPCPFRATVPDLCKLFRFFFSNNRNGVGQQICPCSILLLDCFFSLRPQNTPH